jgi:hypothetical protein
MAASGAAFVELATLPIAPFLARIFTFLVLLKPSAIVPGTRLWPLLSQAECWESCIEQQCTNGDAHGMENGMDK